MERSELICESTATIQSSSSMFNLPLMMESLRLNENQQRTWRTYSESSCSSLPEEQPWLNSDDADLLRTQETVIPSDSHNEPLTTTTQHIELADYQTSLLNLAFTYQSVINKYAAIEQAALIYRTSADAVSRERESPRQSPDQKVSHRSQNYYGQPVQFPINEAPCLSQNDSDFVSFSLRSDLVGPSRIFLDQLTGRCAVDVLAYRQTNIHHCLSVKVFLGGVPMIGRHVTPVIRDQLQRGLELFGPVNLIWPKGITVQSLPSFCHKSHSTNETRRGHCYATFSNPISVALLLSACQRRNKGCYINFASLCPELKLSHLESIQVIPWDRGDTELHAQRDITNADSIGPHYLSNLSTLNMGLSLRRKKQYSVFVGALHGMITARALFYMCEKLFGNVDSVVLDTDRFHYPIGSGRVAFTSPVSYLAAVNANFIQVDSQFFRKTIQIDPYLEDALCCKCAVSPGVYFCRDLKCFDYHCPACWIQSHPSPSTHKPIRRTQIQNRTQR